MARFDFRGDALGNGALAGCLNLIAHHFFSEAEAVAEGNWGIRFFQPYALPHARFRQHCAVIGEIHRVASGRPAEVEHTDTHRLKMFRLHLMFEGLRGHELTRLPAARAGKPWFDRLRGCRRGPWRNGTAIRHISLFVGQRTQAAGDGLFEDGCHNGKIANLSSIASAIYRTTTIREARKRTNFRNALRLLWGRIRDRQSHGAARPRSAEAS